MCKGEAGPQCAAVEALAEGLGGSAGTPGEQGWKSMVSFLLMSVSANKLVRDDSLCFFSLSLAFEASKALSDGSGCPANSYNC